MTYKDVKAARDLPLHRTPKMVLVALAERVDHTYSCWPSQATVALDTGLSRSTVNRALNYLEDVGYISRARRARSGSVGGRTSDRITLFLDSNANPIAYTHWLKEQNEDEPMSHAGEPKSRSEQSKSHAATGTVRESTEGTASHPTSHLNESSHQLASKQVEREREANDRITAKVANAVLDRIESMEDDDLWELYTRIAGTNFEKQTPLLREANLQIANRVNDEVRTRMGIVRDEGELS